MKNIYSLGGYNIPAQKIFVWMYCIRMTVWVATCYLQDGCENVKGVPLKPFY
ncbi:MAG: hypothetical protein IPJ66_06245 [Bacteroidetes bacterium]|nr:hypothetical protein [Bacteroidota bacterium]